jgi:hypothetical protein
MDYHRIACRVFFPSISITHKVEINLARFSLTTMSFIKKAALWSSNYFHARQSISARWSACHHFSPSNNIKVEGEEGFLWEFKVRFWLEITSDTES